MTASLEPIAYKTNTQNKLEKHFHILFQIHAYTLFWIMTIRLHEILLIIYLVMK